MEVTTVKKAERVPEEEFNVMEELSRDTVMANCVLAMSDRMYNKGVQKGVQVERSNKKGGDFVVLILSFILGAFFTKFIPIFYQIYLNSQ
jgi:uncharacterized membrane protein YoaK (UPF0700 family)